MGLLKLPKGPWQPSTSWPGAIYKKGRGDKLPPWEVSYGRFSKGDSLQAIAMNQASGKPVQVSTVSGHILTALTFGKSVDLSRLFAENETTLPDEAAWTKIEEAAVERGCNVDAPDFSVKEVLCGILGPENVNREFGDKTDAAKAEEKWWYERIRLWDSLKKVRFQASFDDVDENAAKRQKV